MYCTEWPANLYVVGVERFCVVEQGGAETRIQRQFFWPAMPGGSNSHAQSAANLSRLDIQNPNMLHIVIICEVTMSPNMSFLRRDLLRFG